MDSGESRCTFKCIACGATDTISGFWLGTGNIGQIIKERTDAGCRQCGERIMLYMEETCYGWDGTSEKVYRDAYQAAHTAYLKSRGCPATTGDIGVPDDEA